MLRLKTSSMFQTTLVAAAIGIFATTGASAGTLVTSWSYQLDNAFTSFAEETNPGGGAVTGTLPNAFLGSNPTMLEWPDGTDDAGNSFLKVGNDAPGPDYGTDSGTLITGASAIDTVLISHGNFPQPLVGGLIRTALDTAVLTDVLRLSPDDGPFAGAGPFPAPAITLNINFKETGDEFGNPPDIFVIDIVGAMFNAISQTFVQEFTFDEIDYEIKVGLEGVDGALASNGTPALDTLTDAQCLEAGAMSGCIGLITREGMRTDFRAVLGISEVAVSEPGTFAVLGLGLLGLGAIRRRKLAA